MKNKMTTTELKQYVIAEAQKLVKTEMLKEERRVIIGQLKKLDENIFNTAMMGGILSNPSTRNEEDRNAKKDVIDAIRVGGMSKEDAINQVASKYGLRVDYLAKISGDLEEGLGYEPHRPDDFSADSEVDDSQEYYDINGKYYREFVDWITRENEERHVTISNQRKQLFGGG